MTARVKYSPGWRGFKVHLDNMDNRMKAQAVEIVNDCAALGAEVMKGEVDRIETGLMKSEVKHKKTRSQYFYARFGWVERMEDYFYYQDRGFDHVGGKHIDGMRALFKGFMVAREELQKRIKEMTR